MVCDRCKICCGVKNDTDANLLISFQDLHDLCLSIDESGVSYRAQIPQYDGTQYKIYEKIGQEK